MFKEENSNTIKEFIPEYSELVNNNCKSRVIITIIYCMFRMYQTLCHVLCMYSLT